MHWLHIARALCSRLFLSSFLLAVVSASTSVAQSQPSHQLQITFPADHAIVASGQDFSLIVDSPAQTEFSSIGVIGPEPFGFIGLAKSLPAHFTVSIPADTSSGFRSLHVSGQTTSGETVEAEPIELDIERPDMPLSLAPDISTLYLQRLGERLPLTVLATFSDRSVVDVTESTYLTFASLDPSIVTVDSQGEVTSVADGFTYVSATYKKGEKRIRFYVSVDVHEHPDNFANQFELSTNSGVPKIEPGDSAAYKFSLAALADPKFTGPVELKLAGVPEGATASFSQPSVSVPGSSTLTILTSRSTPTGIYQLMVTAQSGDLTCHLQLALMVVDSNGLP